MDLPKSIVKEFAKQAVEKKPTVDKPTQLVGTVQVEDGQTFVYLDGSNGSKTPVSETVAYQSGDRVLVSIQNRKATIIGNYTDPSINQALDNVIIEYALSSSSVSFIAWPGEKGEWNTIAPEKEDGSYMWQRTTKISTNPLINPEISLTCIQGSDGENGYTPYIGSNGNWWINGVDTGYSAEGDDGHSPYVDTTTNTWWEWDADIGGYHDTGIVPQGPGVFKSIVFKRFSSEPSTPTGGSYLSPVPSGWSDGIPSGTEQIWISTRVFTSNGESPQTSEWTTPQMASDIPDIDFEYSWIVTNPGNPTDNPDNWSNTATENSIWMAVRKKSIGTWSSWEINKIKGETGADGYSPTVTTGTSSDGSTTVTVTNKGGSTTTVLVDGKARADIDNLEIGGRNLLVGSEGGIISNPLLDGSTASKYNDVTLDGNPLYYMSGPRYIKINFPALKVGEQYTFSCDVARQSGGSSQDVFISIGESTAKVGIATGGIWTNFNVTFTASDASTYALVRVYTASSSGSGEYIGHTRHFKLELGNKATDWTLAPEDVDAGIANVQTGVDSLNDTVFGVQTFEYILDGVTIPAHKREDGTYYYILNDEEVTVAEANLVHDSDGTLVSYQDGGIYESLDNMSENIEAIGTKLNSFDAREMAIYNAIQDNSLIARKNARVEGTSLIITNDTTTEKITDIKNYLQLDPQAIVIYREEDPIVLIGIAGDESENQVGGYMEMRGTSLFIAQESRLSTVRLRSAEKNGKLALVAGSDGHVSLKEVLD